MSHDDNFDSMADVYRVWCDSAPIVATIHAFYVELCSQSDGPCVELGVGNGDVLVEVARRGRAVVGVDSSPAMLDACRRRAAEEGCAERVTLIQADFRDFELPEPARLITIPFHSIGHMVTEADRRACLARIHANLAPDGRLVFDHFVPDPKHARARHRLPSLRAEYTDAEGRDAVLWQCVDYDLETGRMPILAFSDHLDANGVVVERRYRRIDFSWLLPDTARAALLEAGFEIETVWGDFERTPFDPETSHHQVWVARRPS